MEPKYPKLDGIEVRGLEIRNRDFKFTDLADSTWDQCSFSGCDFTFGFGSSARFSRCHFINCRFTAFFFDNALFSESWAESCIFEHARMGSGGFDFISTENSSFYQCIIPDGFIPPAACRELIGEIIRQAGVSPPRPAIQAFGCLVRVHKQVCWDELVALGTAFLPGPDLQIVVKKLYQYPNLRHLLGKWGFVDGTRSDDDFGGPGGRHKLTSGDKRG